MILLLPVLAIVLGCGLALALLVLLVFSWLDEQYGSTAAKTLLGYAVFRIAVMAVMVGGLLTGAVWFVPTDHWRALTLAIGSAGLAGLGGLAWLWRRDREAMGEVLLDLGHVGKKNKAVVRAIGGFGAVLLVVGVLRLDMIWLLYGIYFLCLGVGQNVYDYAHLVITEQGLYAPEGSVRWSRVRSIQWLDGTNHVCVLVIKTRRVIFHTQPMRIPWEALDEVEAIIGDYLPDQVVPETRPRRLSALEG